jgi:hypothetical protein
MVEDAWASQVLPKTDIRDPMHKLARSETDEPKFVKLTKLVVYPKMIPDRREKAEPISS